MAQTTVEISWHWTPMPEQKLLHLYITRDGNGIINYYVTPEIFRKWMKMASDAGLFGE